MNESLRRLGRPEMGYRAVRESRNNPKSRYGTCESIGLRLPASGWEPDHIYGATLWIK